jgi:multiple sugar transport system ATP-binding protein
MAVVTIDRLCKRYDGATEASVKDMSLTVADGEFMVLLGPSGCGKSSALRMIAGLEPITSGMVAIDGRPINHVPAKDRDIAMVFQSYALYPHMTVRENLAFGLRRRKMPREEIDRRVTSVAEKLGLAPFVARKPHALSGGQRQRVALGRAIVRDPKVFLFDEPLSNLDASLRVTTRNELVKQQHELGTTTIYVTHDQVEAMTMGDQICIMNKGEVVQIGKPLEVYRNPADTFVARFLGNPPMNLLAGRLERRDSRCVLAVAGIVFEIPSYSPAALAPYVDGPVTVGLRPEDLYEAPPESGADRMQAMTARILAVEPLGAETLLMLAVGTPGEEITARIGRDTMLRHGEDARLFLDRTAIHLFDPVTTKAIARSPEGVS